MPNRPTQGGGEGMTKADLELENTELRATLLRIKDMAEEAVDYEDDDEEHPKDCTCQDCDEED